MSIHKLVEIHDYRHDAAGDFSATVDGNKIKGILSYRIDGSYEDRLSTVTFTILTESVNFKGKARLAIAEAGKESS